MRVKGNIKRINKMKQEKKYKKPTNKINNI